VGDTGPGGGIVFYAAVGTFTQVGASGLMCTTLCKYLEAAPSGWNTGSDPQATWAVTAYQSTDSSIANDSTAYNNVLGVGLGYANSSAIVTQNGAYNASSNNYAAGAARAYAGGTKNDWYLPTTAELNLLCQWNRGVAQSVTTVCAGGVINSPTYGASSEEFGERIYWSSSELNSERAWALWSATGEQSVEFKNGYEGYIRPVRAF
jgi:hypothetical protein